MRWPGAEGCGGPRVASVHTRAAQPSRASQLAASLQTKLLVGARLSAQTKFGKFEGLNTDCSSKKHRGPTFGLFGVLHPSPYTRELPTTWQLPSDSCRSTPAPRYHRMVQRLSRLQPMDPEPPSLSAGEHSSSHGSLCQGLRAGGAFAARGLGAPG